MNEFKFSDKDQKIVIYGYIPETGEYVGETLYLVPAHTGIPAGATHIEPPFCEEGEVAVFDALSNKWNVVKDYRGKIFYSKKTGEEVIIRGLKINPNLVKDKPPYQFSKWDEEYGTWVEDVEKQSLAELESRKQLKQTHLDLAEKNITILERGKKEGLLTEDETIKLKEWVTFQLNVYRYNPEDKDSLFPAIPK